MSKKKELFVLLDGHGDGHVSGVVTKKLVAKMWKSVDPLYRIIYECSVDDPEFLRRIDKEVEEK